MSIYQMAPVLGPVIAPISEFSYTLLLAEIKLIRNSWRVHRAVHNVEMGLLVNKLVLSFHPANRLHRPPRNLHPTDLEPQSPSSPPDTSKSKLANGVGGQNIIQAAASQSDATMENACNATDHSGASRLPGV